MLLAGCRASPPLMIASRMHDKATKSQQPFPHLRRLEATHTFCSKPCCPDLVALSFFVCTLALHAWVFGLYARHSLAQQQNKQPKNYRAPIFGRVCEVNRTTCNLHEHTKQVSRSDPCNLFGFGAFEVSRPCQAEIPLRHSSLAFWALLLRSCPPYRHEQSSIMSHHRFILRCFVCRHQELLRSHRYFSLHSPTILLSIVLC